MTKLNLILAAVLLIFASYALKANNICEEAKKIHVNVFPDYDTTYVEIIDTNYTLSQKELQCYSGDVSKLKDSWYYFDATQSGLVIKNKGYLELYRGNDCGDLIFVKCITWGGDASGDYVENERYYIRAIGLGVNFSVNIPPIGNSETSCENATIIADNVLVQQSLAGCFIDESFVDENSCKGKPYGDIWFKFSADSSFYKFELWKDWEFDGKVQLFKGDCGQLEFISCEELNSSSNTYYFEEPFEIGKEYFIRVSFWLNSIMDGHEFGLKLTGFAERIHSYCTGAYGIEADSLTSTCQSFNERFVTVDTSVEFPSCWEQDLLYDNWFEFTSLNKEYYVSSNTGNLAVYSGGCDSLTLLGCGNKILLESLSLGERYLVRTMGYGTFCIEPPPVNTTCYDAIELEPKLNTLSKNYAMLNAGISTPLCDSSDVNDIWFTFTANSKSVVFRPYSYSYEEGSHNLALFEGTCEDLKLIDCYENANEKSIRVDDLIVGQKYYFRYSGSTAESIDFALFSIPPNEYLETAVRITEDTCFQTNMQFATGDTTSYSGEIPGFEKRLWYELNPSSHIYSINLFSGDNFEIFKKNASGKIVKLRRFFQSSFEDNLYTRILFNPGDTYYIKVAAKANFKLCVKEIIDSKYFEPSKAKELFIDTAKNYVDLNREYMVYDLWENDTINCSSKTEYTTEHSSVWYYFKPERRSVRLSTRNQYEAFQLYEVTSLEDFNLSCPISEGYVDSYYNLGTVCNNLDTTKIYIIRFVSRSLEFGVMELCLDYPPANSNDEFVNAKEVYVKPIYSSCERTENSFYTANNQPTDSELFAYDCDTSTMFYNDVWFTFVSTDTIQGFSFYPYLGDFSTAYYELYSMKNQKLSCVQFENMDIYTHTGFSTLFKNLEKGERYYLRFPQDLNPQQMYDFSFCIYQIPPPPINDELEGAITLIPSKNLTDCNSEETYHLNMSDNSVWFKFVATDSSHQLVSRLLLFPLDATLYELDTNGVALDSVAHFLWETAFTPPLLAVNYNNAFIRSLGIYNFVKLDIGKEYYVKLGILHDDFTTVKLTTEDRVPIPYEVCLKTLPPPPNNNSIETSQKLEIINGMDSYEYYYATTSNVAFLNYPSVPTCLSPDPDTRFLYAESWFDFKASESSLKILIDNQAQFSELVNSLDSFSVSGSVQFNDLTTYISVYTKDSDDNYSSIVCDVPVDSFYVISDLLVNETYYLKVYYNCINFLTDLNFGLCLSTSIDQDQDGFVLADDCDDNNPEVNPNQTEIVYNGLDDDCDPTTLDDDLDQDGFVLADDCDDENPEINPNQTEIVYNGLDDDCDPSTLDDDLDQDGFVLSDDCDDENPEINPNQTEIVYNGLDDDCDPSTLDDDLDQDGFVLADDCDDTNPNINPDATEIPDNGIDEDCDGMDSTTGIYELANSTIQIYPNPASKVINVKVNGNLDYKLSIFDMNGKLLFKSRNEKLVDIHSLISGIYIFEIEDLKTGQRIVDRIIISK